MIRIWRITADTAPATAVNLWVRGLASLPQGVRLSRRTPKVTGVAVSAVIGFFPIILSGFFES